MADEYRPISEFDGYVIGPDAAVRSVGREVRTKGGAVRVTKARQLRPDDKGRVALRRDGKTYKLRVDELARQHFPPVRHVTLLQLVATIHCRWCGGDFDGFITSHCAHSARPVWPDLFRCPYCTTAVTRLPDHFPTIP